MATDEDTTTRHPVPTGVRTLSAGVTALAERPLFALDAAVTRETIVALADLKARLAAYEYAVLAHAEQVQVGAETGCTSTAVWAANATRTRKNVVAGQVRLATSLRVSGGTGSRDALATGAVNADQARVITTALEDLPDDLDASLLAEAEEALVGYAADFDPVALARLAAHILTLIAPQVGEEIDRKRLEAAEAQGRPEAAADAWPSTPTGSRTGGSPSPRPRAGCCRSCSSRSLPPATSTAPPTPGAARRARSGPGSRAARRR